MKISMVRWAAFALVATNTLSAFAQLEEEEALAQVYGDKFTVSIATGNPQNLQHAPSVASVITAEDIKALGATDLDQVLETVPGLHVARGTQTNTPVYIIRGIHRDTNPQVLMLVNGIPMNTVFQGNRGDVWGGLTLENVARVEVIRGPGSALYGAEAFSGVINITTKNATDINGTQVGVRGGSFDSGDVWAQHGGHIGAIDVAAYFRAGTTAGANRMVTADAQTGLDALMGTHASLAPGRLNDSRDAIDGSLDLSYEHWQLRTSYKERDNVGSGGGIANALDPTGYNRSKRFTTDLTYHDKNFAKNWDVSLQASYFNLKEFSNLVLFPAGANLGGGVFHNGMIGNPDNFEQHGRFDTSATYTGFDQHSIRFGGGVIREEIYKVQESKNFFPGLLPFTPIGTGSFSDVTDFSNTAPFLSPHSRMVYNWFTQDEWHFVKDWTLTAGVRGDYYSDIGQTINPRLALVWDAAYNLTAKLMYGSAFRPPVFNELYIINNPVAIGTATLKPETMQTTEAALSWQATPKLQLGINIFHYEMSNIIQLVNLNYMNTGKQIGNGLEFESTWDVMPLVRLSGNYSYQKSNDDATHHDAGNSPQHHGYVRADWRFMPGWAVNTQLNVVGTRQRLLGDIRAPLAGYNMVDFTLRTDNAIKHWDFTASVRNLFDVNAREPAPASIPNDFPMPGRSFYLQAVYKF